jgi:hypothetical protein
MLCERGNVAPMSVEVCEGVDVGATYGKGCCCGATHVIKCG